MSALCRDCDWRGEEGPSVCAACGSPRLLAHAELERLSIAHLDCDAFYASVEKRDRPELRDRPVIVGGGVRGVVTTACYIARLHGVRSAQPMFKALKACPDAVVVKPDFGKYKEASRGVFDRVRRLTPLVQQLSLDEAWIDLTGSDRLHGAASVVTLSRLQREIEREVGITVSIGLAPNKVLAKIASDIDKPRGFAVIGQADAPAFLADKPVSLLPGVGPAFAASLRSAGFGTVGDLARADPRQLVARFGEYGGRLYELAHGRDARTVNPHEDRKSISAEDTFNSDLREFEALADMLWPLCEKVARKCRADGVAGRVVTLKLKTTAFKLRTRRRTLPVPTQTARQLFAAARELLAPEVGREAFRLIGVGLSEFVPCDAGTADFFAGAELRDRKAETALDALRARFGADAVQSGRALRR